MTSPPSWPATRSTTRRRSRYYPDYRRALESQNRNHYLTGNPSPACARSPADQCRRMACRNAVSLPQFRMPCKTRPRCRGKRLRETAFLPSIPSKAYCPSRDPMILRTRRFMLSYTSFTSILPTLSPEKSLRKAAGARSIPTSTVSRYVTSPLRIHPFIFSMNSARRLK